MKMTVWIFFLMACLMAAVSVMGFKPTAAEQLQALRNQNQAKPTREKVKKTVTHSGKGVPIKGDGKNRKNEIIAKTGHAPHAKSKGGIQRRGD